MSTTARARGARLDDSHAFLRTVVLVSHLDRLPPETHGDVVDDVRRELVAAEVGRGGAGEVVLDDVRLNISAVRAACQAG